MSRSITLVANPLTLTPNPNPELECQTFHPSPNANPLTGEFSYTETRELRFECGGTGDAQVRDVGVGGWVSGWVGVSG